MSTTAQRLIQNIGEVDKSAFPEYPQFTATIVPGPLRLATNSVSGLIVEQMTPARVWQGIIVPFETDADARLALRILAVDGAIPVHGGTLRPSARTHLAKHPAEFRLTATDLAFDVLVVEFDAPAHPWAFSLSPSIFQPYPGYHPHLRMDRSLCLPSKELHALCVYSSAEFAFDLSRAIVPQFIDQVAIFLAKHVIWLRTLRLFGMDGVMIHDGIDMSTLMSTLPAESVWSIVPAARNEWMGLWPGSSALSGAAHLSLDTERECWCGKGKLYKDCHLPLERAQYHLG